MTIVTGFTQEDYVIKSSDDDDISDQDSDKPSFQPGQLVEFSHHSNYKAFERVRLTSINPVEVTYCLNDSGKTTYVDVHLGLEGYYPCLLVYVGWFPIRSKPNEMLSLYSRVPVFLYDDKYVTCAPWFAIRHFRVFPT